jgi:hypothetical protein
LTWKSNMKKIAITSLFVILHSRNICLAIRIELYRITKTKMSLGWTLLNKSWEVQSLLIWWGTKNMGQKGSCAPRFDNFSLRITCRPSSSDTSSPEGNNCLNIQTTRQLPKHEHPIHYILPGLHLSTQFC